MFFVKAFDNSIKNADRCDIGMLANGTVAFSVFQNYFSFVNKD